MRKAATKPAPETKEQRRDRLAAEVGRNPFIFLTSEDIGLLFDFGPDTITTLRSLGAPIVARKINPGLLLRWIEQNAKTIPKIRGEEEES